MHVDGGYGSNMVKHGAMVILPDCWIFASFAHGALMPASRSNTRAIRRTVERVMMEAKDHLFQDILQLLF